MRPMSSLLCCLFSLTILSTPTAPSFAQQPAPPLSLINQDILSDAHRWLANPVVAISIESQNKKYSTLTLDEIDTLDKQWRQERESEDQPLIAATLSSPLSNYLTQIQASSNGVITEMFVMDNKGLNVGQSSITSDFWQGDEAKFQKTFGEGDQAVFIDEAEYEDKSKTWRAQANMTLSDKENNPIGAITIEYNLTELQRRQTAP